MGFLRLQRIEKEYEQLKLENPKLRLEIDKLRDVSAARFGNKNVYNQFLYDFTGKIEFIYIFRKYLMKN